jgi:hypothetical protein
MSGRRFFTAPGDSLLLSHDPIEAALRTSRVMVRLGVRNGNHVIASPLTRLPLPDGAGHDVAAESLWLPFWWWPPSIAGWQQLDNGDFEGTNTRAVRLALELEASGLYDPVSGLWVDVLKPRGIDTTTEDGVSRIETWLRGGKDPTLSELERNGLDVAFQGRSALDSALWLQQRLFHCAWHDGAEALLDVVDTALSEKELSAVHPVSQIASVWFAGCSQWDDFTFHPTLKGVLTLRSKLRDIVDAYADANAGLVNALIV